MPDAMRAACAARLASAAPGERLPAEARSRREL